MQWFYNLSIKMKLLTAFVIILLMMAGLGLFSVVKMGAINNAASDIANNWLPSARLIGDMRRDLADLRNAELRRRHTTSPAQSESLEHEMAAAQSLLLKNQSQYVPLIASEHEQTLYRKFSRWRDEYLRLVFSDKVADSGDLDNAYWQARHVIEAIIKLSVDSATLVNARADEVYAQSIRWLVITVASSMVLAILLIALIDIRISRPIRRLARAAGKISQGDLTVRSQLAHEKDELGELALTFDQMAEALQRREQEAKQADLKLAQRHDQLQAVYRHTEAVNQMVSVEDIYQKALDTLRDTTHADRTAVLLLDEQGVMRFVAGCGLSDHYRRQAEGHSPWIADAADAQPIRVADVAQEASLATLQDALREEGIGALAFIPLLNQKRLLGKFMLYHNQPHFFSDDEIQLAQTIANHVAFAIERARQTARLEHQALYDSLTDIPNRALLHDRLRQAIISAQRTGDSLALLLLDLDRFKDINDTLGHDWGDRLLQQIGPRIQGVLRQSDTVARLGGDEFAVLLWPVGDANHAVLTADKILQALQAPFIAEGIDLRVGASIGIVLYPDHGADVDTLMRHADVAMYAAKQRGVGQLVYAHEQDQHSLRQLTLISELRQAIEQNQLVLHYQPKLSFKSRNIIGVEALVRWAHPQHGLIYPDQFIPQAEQTGLMKPLTLWVIEQALQQHVAWRRLGHVISVAVNLSARNLQDVTLPKLIAALLHQYQTSPDMLVLEITESAIMRDPDRALEVLTQIGRMGVHLSIDDFGTGYSSLAYLQKLPVDTVKIDKSFVLEMSSHAGSAVIVRSTIELAHNLGISVIAEGVETQQTWHALSALNCDTAQGYYSCQPIPGEEMIAWLQADRINGAGQKTVQ